MHYNKLKNIFAILLTIGLCSTQAAAKSDIAIVVGSNSDLEKISTKDLRSIYLGKLKKLPNGQFAIPIHQTESSTIQSNFIKKVIKRSKEELKTYWVRRSFSGKGTAPRVINGDESTKRFLNGIPGTIGYIDSANVDGSVKVLLTIPSP